MSLNKVKEETKILIYIKCTSILCVYSSYTSYLKIHTHIGTLSESLVLHLIKEVGSFKGARGRVLIEGSSFGDKVKDEDICV